MFAADIDADVMSALKDGHGDYYDVTGLPVAQGIELIVDPNLQRVGPEGLFLSDAYGVTWLNAALATVTRGGYFMVGPAKYIVEEKVSDDGHWSTAACMVTT